MTVSTDLADMLRTEMEYLYEDRARTDAKIAAIHMLLETVHETPKATFTADDARNHAERPVDVVEPPIRNAHKGSRSSLRASLSAAELTMIRVSAAAGESYAALAGEYKVSRSTIGNIVQKKGCYE